MHLVEYLSRGRSELLGAGREPDALGAAVGRIRPTSNEPSALNLANQRRHVLLAHPRAVSELTHTEAVLAEQGEQHRPERRSHLREPVGAAPLPQDFVPALQSLRQEVAKVVSLRCRRLSRHESTVSDQARRSLDACVGNAIAAQPTVRPATRQTVRVRTILDFAAPAGGFTWHSRQAASPGRSDEQQGLSTRLARQVEHNVRKRERRLKETMR